LSARGGSAGRTTGRQSHLGGDVARTRFLGVEMVTRGELSFVVRSWLITVPLNQTPWISAHRSTDSLFVGLVADADLL
jgi:hypothetical protein